VLLIFGAEHVVGSGRRKDRSRPYGTGDEPVVLAGDGTQDGRVESGHELVWGIEQGGGLGGLYFNPWGSGVLSALSGDVERATRPCQPNPAGSSFSREGAANSPIMPPRFLHLVSRLCSFFSAAVVHACTQEPSPEPR